MPSRLRNSVKNVLHIDVRDKVKKTSNASTVIHYKQHYHALAGWVIKHVRSSYALFCFKKQDRWAPWLTNHCWTAWQMMICLLLDLSYTAKLSPQPHVRAALGLLNWNPFPFSPPENSSVVSARYKKLFRSVTTLMPLSSKTWSFSWLWLSKSIWWPNLLVC